MAWKKLMPVAIILAAGLVVALLVRHGGSPGTSPVVAEAIATVVATVNDDAAALRADHGRQVAALETRLEAVRTQMTKPDGASPTLPHTAEGRFKRLIDRSHARLAAVEAQETTQLMAAGYTEDRIEWIRRRSEELAAEFRRRDDEFQQQGKRDFNMVLAHNADSDIDLRYELGDDEYARYRQAQGRPIGMQVAAVMPGGYGASAGLKPGDEIVSYNGARVFNVGELNAQIVKYTNFGNIFAFDVMRDGQRIRLNAPAGDLRIRASMPVRTPQDQARLGKMADAAFLEAARRKDARNR